MESWRTVIICTSRRCKAFRRSQWKKVLPAHSMPQMFNDNVLILLGSSSGRNNGKYTWINVLKHAKTLVQSFKKALTTALVAMKVIQHVSLEQHTQGCEQHKLEGKLLCEATVNLYLQMIQRQRNSNSSSTKKQSHPWVQRLLFQSFRLTAVWSVIIMKSFLVGSRLITAVLHSFSPELFLTQRGR